MQVFLPYPSFTRSAQCLDDKRLGNQVYRECKSIINGGWLQHPASKIWANHKHTLAKYALACLCELEARGRFYPEHIAFFIECLDKYEDTGSPNIIGDKEFHLSHRSNLVRKDKNYKLIFGNIPDDIPYKWS